MANWPIYNKGNWDAICDSCGRKFKATELRQRWDGLMVCRDDWEPRQPQDFVRAKTDIQAVPWTRPESSDVFQNYCTTNTSIVGLAIVGCAIVGNAVDTGIVPSGTFTP